jgi:hypothetical protein
MLMPRHSSWSSLVAYAAACWWGVANTGVVIGGTRLVFSEVVPGDNRIGYSSVYYAWAGLAGGIGPLAAGRALAHFANLKAHLLGWSVDTYTPLFLASVALILGGAALYRTIGRSRNLRRHDHSPA